jgi:hypothetical protein
MTGALYHGLIETDWDGSAPQRLQHIDFLYIAQRSMPASGVRKELDRQLVKRRIQIGAAHHFSVLEH